MKSDGTVWKRDVNGGAAPTQVPGLAGVRAIANHNDTGYALMPDGTVDAWGGLLGGALGDGQSSPNPRITPAPIAGVSGVTVLGDGGVCIADNRRRTHAVAGPRRTVTTARRPSDQ